MRSFRAATLSALVLFGSIARPAAAEIDARQVGAALDRAVEYLKSQQRENGAWVEIQTTQDGITALCTLALLNAGVGPEDPNVQRALNFLRQRKPEATYQAALQVMVFCAAEPKKDLLLIRRNVKWLEATQRKNGDIAGGWSYPYSTEGIADNSNSQFALLALHEAERAGVPVAENTWDLALKYWERNQNPDGSWGYPRQNPGTGSMTTAGLASMVIASGQLNKGDAEIGADGQVRCCGDQTTSEKIDKALRWLEVNFAVDSNPGYEETWLLYYLYGVERAGRLTARRFIGTHDWYREGSDFLIRKQDRLSGFWIERAHGGENAQIGTALALLFLAKGRRPVLAAKLKYGDDNDWNHHRGDMANLTEYVERKWKRDLTWQVIDVSAAKVDDLLQAPVLYLSGKNAPQFSAEEKKSLRAYVDRGGFIFAESCCGNGTFQEGFQKLMEEIFPESESAWHEIGPRHSIWRVEEPIDPSAVKLYGIDTCCRTSVIFCPMNLSCFWELSRQARRTKIPEAVKKNVDLANAVGINVLAYATNRELKYKYDAFQLPSAASADEKLDRGAIQLARIQHTAGGEAVPGALTNLARLAREKLRLRATALGAELPLGDERLFDQQMVLMHGRQNFSFTPAERKQLRAYLDRGGVLVADAICSSRAFADSFRREMKLLFPEQQEPLARIPVEHAIFSAELGGETLRVLNRRQPERAAADGPLRTTVRSGEPFLEGVKLGDRYAVVFSRYDLSCALESRESLDCEGYTRQDAARIGLNVLLYALQQ